MTLGNWGQSLLNAAVGLSGGGIDLKDYAHAAKTFRSNSYEYAPKLKFLFHTYFEINPEAISYGEMNYGLLVKEIKLPSFSFQTHQLNQYNRKRIVQTKIKYDPIEIVFHDDAGDNINRLWEQYYTYYYNDGTKPQAVLMGSRGSPFAGVSGDAKTSFNDRNIYNDYTSGDDDWGFVGGSNTQNNTKVPFFKNITVFGMNQHEYTAYTLINPLITNFAHDTYNYNEGGGIMQNRMSIDYETVVYNYGSLDGRTPGQIVTGFGDPANYDTDPSPIMYAEANGAALGRGGLVDAVGGSIASLRDGNVLGAVVRSGVVYENLQNPNLVQNSALQLTGMFFNTLQNTPVNRNTMFSAPTAGSTPGQSGTAGYPPIGAQSGPVPITTDTTAGSQNNGSQYLGDYQYGSFPVDAPFNTGPTNIV